MRSRETAAVLILTRPSQPGRGAGMPAFLDAPDESITNRWLGKDQFGCRRIVFKLFSEVRDVNSEVMRLVYRFVSPDFRQQLAMCQDFSGVSNQESKQRILDGC